MTDANPVFLFLSVGSVSLFSFVAVSSWADARRREREAFYRSETLKKVAEAPPSGAALALDFLRERDRKADARTREGIKLGGLIMAATGMGVMIFLRNLLPEKPAYVSVVIPLLIGFAMLAYSYLLAPKE